MFCKKMKISFFILLTIFFCLFAKQSSQSQPNKFIRNNFNTDQESRSYYPSNYKRFRRGYGLREETDFNQFPSFGGSSNSGGDSFGTYRKGNLGNRKGAPRTFPNNRFPSFGGPDAFLSPTGNIEDNNADESVNLSGNPGAFSGFSSSSSSWGKQVSTSKGRSKGGIKTSAAAKSAKPAAINFGSETSRFTAQGNIPQFPFGSNTGTSFGSPGNSQSGTFGNSGNNPFGASANSGNNPFGTPTNTGNNPFGATGNSGNNPFGAPANSGNNPFGGSTNFGNQKPFFQPFTNSKSRSFSSKSSSYASGSESFPNPFLNPGGFGGGSQPGGTGPGNSFGGIGNQFSFTGNTDELPGGKVGSPFKSFPDISNLDLDSLLEQLEPTTTTKKPLRVISEEDRNKIFSGDENDDEDSSSKDDDLEKLDDSFIPINFENSEKDTDFPNPFLGTSKGKGKKQATPTKSDLTSNSCKDPPKSPVNAEMRCTGNSGCRLECLQNYQTPDGETRLYLRCENGVWKAKGKEFAEIPNCEPICDPPCRNNGICLAPNLCNCPDGWEGPQCEKAKKGKQCSNKPPTPHNTRVFCGKEQCNARCTEGYEFEGGVTKVSYVCENGKWTLINPDLKNTPNCNPICDPNCINGGICLAPNICECSSEFRGPICQYPISNCDPNKMNFNGRYNCSGEDMDFGCRLWCPYEYTFKFPAADFYSCDYATGKWSPSPIPECDYTEICKHPPKTPANAEMKCSTYSGCRIDCLQNYQTPDGETRLYLKCENEVWKANGKEFTELPNCEPICDPPCQNNGICLAPNLCNCPDDFEGSQCEKSKKKKQCSKKPPTPHNSRMMCSQEGCHSRCVEGYEFENGDTKLFFVCENGKWGLKNQDIKKAPNCKPICDPNCINGGICLAPNICECSSEFRGPICQYPISNCDPKKLNFNGGYNCSGENMNFGCRLWCPEGVSFTFPEAESYSCDYATGKWSPFPIPECDYSFLFVTESTVEHMSVIKYKETAKPSSGTCFTWSGSHYKSFDGKVYSFESGCPYTLLQDSTLGTFSVNLMPEEGCKGPHCKRSLNIFAEDDQYVLGSSGDVPVLTYKDTSLAIPSQMNGLVSERVAHYVVLKLTGIGLTLKWDLESLFVAEISEVLWNRTSGLCGRLDGSVDNDWAYSDGSSENSLTTFLNAWQATTVGAPCREPPVTKSSCNQLDNYKAEAHCSKLSDDPRFEPCRELVDVEPFVTACKWDYCSCKDKSNLDSCTCKSFEAFFRECTNRGGSIEEGWRTQELCPMTCEVGLEYKSCMPAIQPRCGQAADTAEPEFCVEGCDCPSGLVLSGEGGCINPEECPCTYHNKTYYPGDTIPNDCNTCTCLSGEWVCTEVKCGSRCASVGDPHYTTFDGKKYEFMGKCSYYLARGADFSIEAENTPCAGAISKKMNFPTSVVNKFPSCTKSVTIKVPGTKVHLKQNREVTINGEEVKDFPVWVNDVFVKEASSLFVLVYLGNGIEVWWDGQTRVYVDAPPEMRGHLSGLCGTFNDNQKDDFITPEGDNEQNPASFANKWKTSRKCSDIPIADEAHPCDRHVQNKGVAEKYCTKLKSKIFSGCHLEVDPESFYRDCLYDLCSCEAELKSCMCPIFAAYGKECARKGIIVDWRSKIRECGIHCTGGQKYQICGDSCAHKCYDIAVQPKCKKRCVEGCNCPEGFALDSNDVCVPVSECPCVYDGKEFKPDYEMFQKDNDGSLQICQCVGAQWECRIPTAVEKAAPEFFTEPQAECKRDKHEVYTDCLPEEEPSCTTMHLYMGEEPDVCKPGCRCEDGFVRNDETDECVSFHKCPCHHGGRTYKEGDTIIEECNTCICEDGIWSCSQEACPAICTAWGDSHYKTFDGRIFDFHGTCDYMLAKGKLSRNDVFEISIQNVPCGTNGVTCAKSLTLRVGKGEDQEVVQFSRNKPPPMRNMTRTILREAGVFVFAEVADMGLELQWDRGTRAYVTLDPSWEGKHIQGLCGNYNGDENDDFQTPSGGSGEASVKIFGDSWRLQNYCPDSVIIEDTCAIHPHRRIWASEKCAILKSSTFSSCHSEVPVEPYLERCQFDACGCDTGGDCHCLCTAVAAYAQECNKNGVFIKWRTPDFCPMQCDESCEHYEPCIPTCPAETCDSYKEPRSTLCRRDSCVEGCAKDVCPPGKVHKSATDKECIPKIDCEKKCLEIDGEVFMEGDIVTSDECHTCYCTKGKKTCKGTPCETTTELLFYSSPDSTRVTTPPVTSSTESKECRTGWSSWINRDHPIVYKKNSDIESMPEVISQILSSGGFCGRDMFEDIRCRSVADHRPPMKGVSCNLEEGLRCEMPKGAAKGGRNCLDYEISIYCDCSKEVSTTESTSAPETPVTAPPIVFPSIPPSEESIPESCEENGWTPYFNVHFPTKFGEFETLENIREGHKICPDHYVKDVDCRAAGGGPLDKQMSCDKSGALCRNNGGIEYCQDAEVRVLCECECQDGLGLADGSIIDESITSSSSVTGGLGRLNSKEPWIPKDVLNLPDQWLQIELEEMKVVTGVITQGHSSMDAYLTSFAIQVSKTGSKWDEIRDEGTDFAKIFTGNKNSFEHVTNLFPKPVLVKYVRIIPLSFISMPALRVELKGCAEGDEDESHPGSEDEDKKDKDALKEEITTQHPKECQDGWTPWMNSHVPSPFDWDDIENYKSLRLKYAFCDEKSVQLIECRVATVHTPFKESGQVELVCNRNVGLQCVDELQKEHCYDYEVRFLCDCSLTTPSEYSTTISTYTSTVEDEDEEEEGDPCDVTIPATPHKSDCAKFFECQFIGDGFKLVEKECSPGTLFNHLSYVCDWPSVVDKIRPECKEGLTTNATITTTTVPYCEEDYWTEWFNISHPEGDSGDFELFADIRESGLEICKEEHFIDIQCRFTNIKSLASTKKGRKSRKSTKGRAKPERYTNIFSDFSETDDVGAKCSLEEGLRCENRLQRQRVCHDYAIRVLCSCESAQKTTTTPKLITPSTTAFQDYTDVRTGHPTTSPRMYNDYMCPSGKYFEDYAIKCVQVCLYYRKVLMQQGRCLEDDETAPACVDEVTGQACPPGYFLRNNSTCVMLGNCNCILPNGMSAPPERTFLVSDCEICKCSNNELLCDNSRCYDKPREFDCDEWSPWMSVSAPSGQGDMETLDVLKRYHPQICDNPDKIECREKESEKPYYSVGQKVTCNTATGFQCLNKNNPGGCKDYEVRIFCPCKVTTVSPLGLTKTPDKEYYTTTPLPPLDGCVEPYWTEWFNVTHPRIKGGDYELIDVIIREGLDICPKAYITKIECGYYREVKTPIALQKGRKKFTKGRPAKLRSSYEIADYTESDDMYVTCSKLSGLTCVNALQAKSKRCQDYAIRVFCNCESDEIYDPKEKFTPAGTPSTTPYPGWPVIGEKCEEETVRVECAIECHRTCLFYRHYLNLGGECPSDEDCAPACMEPYKKEACPDGLYMADNSTCVEIDQCTCHLPNGQPLPGGMRMQVSKCEWCSCDDNVLNCEQTPGCIDEPEVTSEPESEVSILPDLWGISSSTVFTTQPPLSLIKIRCNEWTPWMNMKRTSVGDSQLISDLKAQYEDLCEKPLNISCRDAIAKLPAAELGQTITCNTEEGLICRNAENREDCYDYEVSLFCECEEGVSTTPKDALKSTLAPAVTTELVPCDGYSPWINEHKPWLEDGDTEFQTLEHMREKYSFCLEGHISEIECLEATSGMDLSVNKGVRCDKNFGLRCKNEDQDNGVCYDFKIRYYCTCGTTVATRPTLLVRTTPTPPSVCDPDRYIDLLEFVDDSAFSATSSISSIFGPASARLKSEIQRGGAWVPKGSEDQYLQIDLGEVKTLYGFYIAGSSISNDRVTSLEVTVSDDDIAWSPVSPPIFRGPKVSKIEDLNLFSGPIEAQYIRFYPLTWSGEIAMRVEIVGCSMPTPTPVPTSPKPPICDEEMGLENGDLGESQIQVSSVLNDMDFFYGKGNVRLNNKVVQGLSGGAWVAKPSPNEYIRFDFLQPSKVSGVITQGRDETDEFVESYTVRYSPDGKTWSTLTDPKTGEDKVFSANYDSSTPIENTFDRVIEAQYLEIRPVTWNANIAMRIEIKGCFHPYPEAKPTSTTVKPVPPPPYCEACPDLPPEYFDKCYPCKNGEKFDGETCVPDILCPCYYEGVKYILGTYFENKECESCVCEGSGVTECKPIECDECTEEGERPVQTPSCKCVCKPCPENTRLCTANDFCLEDKKWCDGIEHCPNDEIDCPTLAPPECPIPECPEEWELTLEIEGDSVVCPQYTCQPPEITTPMSCPSPLCPFGYNIILIPKKSYEACPKYECEAPETTLEPYTCPPPTCPNGYEIEVAPGSYDQYSQFGSYDQHSYDENDGCPQFKCVTNAPPTAPCPPPNCPQGYDVYYPNLKDILSLCPTYECVPIVTTTPCPPVECPKGLHTLFVQTDGELCPQYTCIKITTPSILTTPAITDMPCREVALPVCEPGEEIYQANPFDNCPVFKCKKIGSPPPTTISPKTVVPTCELKNKDFTTFDGTEYHMDICHHILVRDKIDMEWQLSIHENCTEEPCERYLRIAENNSTLILNPDLTVMYDGHSYSISQAQKIGQTSKLFTISKLGDSLVYKSEARNYTVIWNVETDLKIEISDNAIYQVDGLCGFFSGSPVDDRTKPDGSLAATTKEFGDAWSMPEGDCKKPPKKCSPEENKKAFILCNALDSKPFTECHDVLPVEHYLKGCVDRLCVCLKENKTEEDCKCGVLASYITACLEKKPDANVADWRIVTKCYKECPPGEIYKDCYKAPCEKTCDNLNNAETCSQSREGPCVSGCFCEPGLVRKGDTCVVPESCRDCICEGYGDPHYKSFDRKNFTFNGECPYVAARDVDPTGKHQFQIINNNKRCQKDPITMCTESVQVLYNDHDILIKLLPSDSLVTTIDGLEISTFPLKEDWIAMENPDEDRITLVIPEIELEVSYTKDNYGFNIRVPSHLFKNKLEGLCGNCNFDIEDDFRKRDGTITESVREFGLSWVSDSESDSECQVYEKEDIPCVLPHPDVDPCLKLMDREKFGECHPLENPVAYLSSCQLDLCLAINPEKSACQSLEAYARRCSQLGVCLDWRSDDLCPKSCPEHLEYVACGPGCVKTCDNYEELKKNPKSCLISSSDGCYCPNNMVLDNNTCVNETACTTCDAEGHRVGDVWKTDNCTVCECSNGAAICKTTSCPLDPVCNEGYVIEEVPDTFDECCGFQKTCKIKPLTNCLEPLKPSEDCGYGKRLKLIEAPGVCPEYACVCVDPEDCPTLELPKKEDLKPGEEWVLETKGCCPRYIPSCTGECPSPDCQEFYNPEEKPLLEGQCCPEFDCVPPTDACIYEPQYVVEDGFERPLKDEEKPTKILHQVGEKWLEGLCIECECNLNTENKPVSKCLRKTCTKIEEHPDRKAYVLEETPVPNTCCPKIDRMACIDDDEEFLENGTYIDPINACRSVECKRNDKGTLEKVEQISSCDENCALGWKYEPSPLAPLVCCGGCEQIACEYNGELKEVGETWYSEDLCTVYECIRDESEKIQTRGKEISCGTPTEEERNLYLFKDSKNENTCCSTHTRLTCLMDGNPMEPGEEIIDPKDKCMRILCEKTADGNVTRKEKEQSCNTNCPLGHLYMEPPLESEECCGTCIQTQCVEKDVIHPIGDIWENPKDICYQYKCDMREDTLTVLAIKRDCPYFDPECPPSEILIDPTGCCKICNITRETKRECQPEEIDPRDTIDMFVLEARTVGRCTNPNPVYGFKRCNGQCDSRTVFRAQGIDARHISECYCCQPSKTSQIEVVLKCNRGYSFQRVYENIEACECLPCQSLQRDDQYVKDQPIADLTEFIPMNDEGSKTL